MSHGHPETQRSHGFGFFRGLGELAAFLKESAFAVLEVAFGRWPKAYGDRSRTDRDEANITAAAIDGPRGRRTAKSTPRRDADDKA